MKKRYLINLVKIDPITPSGDPREKYYLMEKQQLALKNIKQ